MSAESYTVTGVYTDDLPAVANSQVDVGEPGMSHEAIVQLFASMVSDDQLFHDGVAGIKESHFRANEPAFAILRRAMIEVSPRLQRPSLAEVRTAVEQWGQQEQRASNGLVPPDLPEAIGLLNQIDKLAQNGHAFGNGKALLHQFLRERDVFEPILSIATFCRSGFDSTCRVPTNMAGILHRASERLDELDRDWGDGEAWGIPQRLDGPELPLFPVHVLPPTLHQWVDAEATATQTPLDLAAMLALSVCAAAGAKRVEVDVRPGFREPINIFSTIALEPGNRKSAVFSDATAPLRAYEQSAVEEMRPHVRAYETQLSILTSRHKQLENTAARQSDPERRQAQVQEAIAAREEMARPHRVVEPKLLIDDCTMEKMEQVLAEQGERIAVMSPEGGVFGLMTGRYSDSPNFEVYLKGHSGDEIRTDRVNREAVFVARPAITMALTVQLEVIRGLGQTKSLRGQGLLARILYSLPQSTLGRRQTNSPPVPEEIVQGYHRLVLEICHLSRYGAPSLRQEPHCLRLSPEAAACFEQFERDLEPRLARWGDLAGIQDWAGKLAGAVIRLAGILHLAGQADERLHEPAAQREEHIRRRERIPPFAPWDTPISDATLTAAVAIAEYLVPHAQAAFAMMGVGTGPSATVQSQAWQVLMWIQRSRRTSFTKRELHQDNRAHFAKAGDVDPVLSLLEARNIVRAATHRPMNSKGGRPPSPRYLVNPAVFEWEYVGPEPT
jgi:hypothetical protein